MTWKPKATRQTAKLRAALLKCTRRYFEQKDILEVATPALVQHAVTDPSIDSISLSLNDRTTWLHTSPEHCMKRLLAAGFPDIYSIGPVFRAGELSSHHLPEFTMIEWYRIGFGLREIVNDALSLASELMSDAITEKASIVEYRDVFTTALSLDPLTAAAGNIADALDADESLRSAVGEDRDAWLDLAMVARICPSFPKDRLTVVRHYPSSQAALARLCPANPSVADRFEIYCGTVELANGFVELTDPDELQARFEQDRKKRVTSGKPDIGIDEHFIDALRSGLPDCAGVAFGFDRMLMIAAGLDRIDDAVTFTPGPATPPRAPNSSFH